ncbi:aldehyde dehydrogenase family protein [Alteromonadaceae bacterium M269]|nr:aldehyde dehydrogenase family protein [Alteromonadaceae bacterium M269]
MNESQLKMLINGELQDSPTTFDVINPDNGEVLAAVPDMSPAQVNDVLIGANNAFKVWSKFSLTQREELIIEYANLLESHKDEIIDLLISETGKPFDNAEYDFGMLITCLRYFVEEAKRIDQPCIVDPDGRFHHYVQRQPLGVVVGYLAWNYPLLNIGYKLGPALAAGCTVIIKPSQVTPLATLRCAELALEVGFPSGVINVITSNNYAVTDPLLTSDITSLFTMIGSTASGVNAMRTACTTVKHFSVELGGNAPVIVYDDADIERATNDIVNLKYTNSGQVCVSPNRCFVHESVYQQFLSLAKQKVSEITLGTGKESSAQKMGPLSSEKERARILSLIESALKDGAKLVLGGEIPKERSKGFYLEPTILEQVTTTMDIARQEIFGPVLSVIPFTDDDDVIGLANDCEFGLAAYVYTTDLTRGLQAADDIQAGSVCINEVHYSVQLPHGGLKQSGVGKDCSSYSLEEYLTNKRVSILVRH